MLTKINVLPEEEFTKWYQGRMEKEVRKGPPPGFQLYQVKGCIACHSLDGSPRVGPTFKGLFGKSVMVVADGKEKTVEADEAYLRKSILEPNADLVKGFPPVMPPEKLTSAELDEIVKYLKTVK
jgi:cytochrome c oxidase subunit 2